jgi:hypothetical protein
VSQEPRTEPEPSHTPHAVELAGLLHELTASLISAESMPVAMDRLAVLAAGAVPGVAACSVTLIGDGAPRVYACSAPSARVLDDIQFASGGGPGLDATRTRTVVTCADLAEDDRWPEIARCAGETGLHAVAALPLDLQRNTVGALTLFGSAPGGVGPPWLIMAMAVVGQAEVLLGEVARRTDQAATTADLVASMRGGATVDHAVGVIVAQRGCGVQEAYGVLHETAQRLGLRPREVAEKLVQSAVRRAESP